MAYGVKYRLIFSDVLGHGKKVEILKKDYTGDVLPMIGGSNPVQISWQSSDDFYKPIIGSKCTLQLMVTETVQYDDFYKFDEREYKVVVYYAQSQGEIFAGRVQVDGGTCESFECIDNVLTNLRENFKQYEIEEYLNQIRDRAAFYENNQTTVDILTEFQDSDDFYLWTEYWSGFLVVDRYKEKMMSPPFGVTFNAFDGLGTLSNFEAPLKETYDGTPGVAYNDAERIDLILSNLDLDLDVYYINDIQRDRIVGSTRFNFPEFTTFPPGLREQINGYDISNAKDQLTLLLASYNMRIFQSYNKWFIIEASNIFDNNVKNIIYNEIQSTGIVPTNIRQKINAQLQNTKKEYLKTLKYVDGVYTSESIENLLYEAPNKLIPLKTDLSKEFLQPINKIITDEVNDNVTNADFNAGFEYGTTGFSLSGTAPNGVTYNNRAELNEGGVVLQGNKSLKYSVTTQFPNLTPFFQMETFRISNILNEIENYKLKFSYYVEIDSTTDSPITNKIEYWARMIRVSNTSQYRDWDNENKRWVSEDEFPNYATNFAEQTDFNKWKEVTVSFNTEDLDLTNVEVDFVLTFCSTQCTDSNYITTYFDNIQIVYDDGISSATKRDLITQIDNNQIYTTEKTIKRQVPVAESYKGFLRTRDNYGTFSTTNYFKNIYEIENQNIANDFREFVTRYDGTFRNNKVQPLSMHNKLWFNWLNYESDPQSTIIDGLSYNLKNAEYKIKSHLPNDDDDVDVINTIK